jgi:hypothetical protein
VPAACPGTELAEAAGASSPCVMMSSSAPALMLRVVLIGGTPS